MTLNIEGGEENILAMSLIVTYVLRIFPGT